MNFVNVLIQSILTAPVLEALINSIYFLKHYSDKENVIEIVGSSRLFLEV